MIETSIGHPATHRKETESPPCGCVVGRPRRGGGREVTLCTDGERLWGGLIDARDAMAADGKQRPGHYREGRRSRVAAFVEARGAYELHVFGGAR